MSSTTAGPPVILVQQYATTEYCPYYGHTSFRLAPDGINWICNTCYPERGKAQLSDELRAQARRLLAIADELEHIP